MKRSIVILVTLGLLGILVISCSTRYGQLSVASTKNIDINKKEFDKVKSDVIGVSKVPIIIIIPMGEPSIEDAIDAALKEAGGDLMQNVVIYYKWFYIPYIYGEYKWEVKGDVYKLQSVSTSSIEDPTLIENAQTILVKEVDGVVVAEKLEKR